MAFLLRASDRPRTFNAICLLALVAVAFGGSSRYEVLAPLAVLITGLGVMAFLVWVTPPRLFVVDAGAALLMTAFVALYVIQLIPLPYALWSLFPGRGYAVDVYAAIGVRPWLPVSLTPQRTLAGMFALVAPFVAFLATYQLEAKGRRNLMIFVILLAGVSALLGVIQMAAGADSGFRFYRITVQDAGVGVFANPNHQGCLLAIGVIFTLAVWGERFTKRGPFSVAPTVAMLAAVALLATGIILAGSRAGFIFLGIALFAGVAILPFDRIRLPDAGRRAFIAVAIGLLLMCLAGLALVAFDPAVQRLIGADAKEGRLDMLPRYWQMMRDLFPFGSGLGSFDLVYRLYETPETLTMAYLNQAHNEPAQLLIEGGLGGLLLIIAGMAWWGIQAGAAWRGGLPTPEGMRIRRAAAVATGIVLLHSTVDYPLRTPAIAVVFGIACALMLGSPQLRLERGRRN